MSGTSLPDDIIWLDEPAATASTSSSALPEDVVWPDAPGITGRAATIATDVGKGLKIGFNSAAEDLRELTGRVGDVSIAAERLKAIDEPYTPPEGDSPHEIAAARTRRSVRHETPEVTAEKRVILQAQAEGQAARKPIGRQVVESLDAVDRYFHPEVADSGDLLKRDTQAMRRAQSPEQQAASDKKWWDEDKGTFGDAWTDWRSYAGGLVESLPEQALTMLPAMRLAKASYGAQLAAGATADVAAKSAARTALLAGGLSEGALGGAQSSREVREKVNELPSDVLNQSDGYKALLQSGLSPEDARAALADDLATRAFITSGIVTGMFGGMGDRAIVKIFTEQVGKNSVRKALGNFGKGALAEGLFEELPQSAGQQLAQNEAIRQANPDQPLMADVINQGLGGAAIGGLQGGGMGAASGAGGARRNARTAPGQPATVDSSGALQPAGVQEDDALISPHGPEGGGIPADPPEVARAMDTIQGLPQAQPQAGAAAPIPSHGTLSRAVAAAPAAIQPQSDVALPVEPQPVDPAQLGPLLAEPPSPAEIRAQQAAESAVTPSPVAPEPTGAPAAPAPLVGQQLPEPQGQTVPASVDGPAGGESGQAIPQATRADPVRVETAADLDRVGHRADPEPSEAQREAGNYRKDHIKIAGLDVSIETPQGGIRRGTGPEGPWQVEMPAHYGYVKRTTGKDGDQVDVYVGPQPESARAFVVDQYSPATGKFDEHKVMLGFPDEASAVAAYDAGFSDGSGPTRRRSVSDVPVDEFKAWLKDGDTKKPFAKPEKAVAKRKPTRNGRPLSLIEFIAQNGGISPKDPLIADVRAVLGTPNRFIPGFGMLIRPTGRGLDAHREALVEAGYLRDPGNDTGGMARTTAADVIELMDSNARGGKVHSEQDRQEVAKRADADRVKAAQAAIKELREAVKAEGLIASEKQIEDAARSAAISNKAPIDELVDILERDAVAQIEQEAQAVEDEESSDEVDRPAARAVGEASTSTRQQSSHQGTEASEPAPRSGNPDQPERVRGEAEDVPETPGAGQPADEWRAGDGDQSGGRAIAQATAGRSEDRAPRADQPAPAEGVAPVRDAGRDNTPKLREGKLGPDTALFQTLDANAAPFYSAVERAVEKVKLPKAPPVQWLNTLRNVPGVKQEEMDWLGLADWLKEQSGAVTKDAVLDYIRANKIEVKEVTKGPPSDAPLTAEQAREILRRHYGPDYDRYGRLDTDAEAIQEATELRFDPESIALGNDKTLPRYHSYQLPGGENYRETLLTLPRKEEPGPPFPEGGVVHDALDNGNRRPEFRSSHWDEPNVLAHVRFNDRVIDGKRTLFIEEIQSDWHQQGRRKGYETQEASDQRQKAITEASDRLDDLHTKRNQVTDDAVKFVSIHAPDWVPVWDSNGQAKVDKSNVALALGKVKGDSGNAHADPEVRRAASKFLMEIRAATENIQSAEMTLLEAYSPRPNVPDAPFKTTWPELSLKRMIRYASENGYEQVAWTPGHVQAERYDLSKHIDELNWWKDKETGTFDIEGVRDGNAVLTQKNLSPEQVAEFVGKDMADKIVKGEGRSHSKTMKVGVGASARDATFDIGSLSGLDLKVGGEGMVAFYDRELVNKANALGKKYGAKVGSAALTTPTESRWEIQVGSNSRTNAPLYNVRDTETRESLGVFDKRADAEALIKEFEADAGDAATSVHTLPITPALRDAAVGESFALFQEKDAARKAGPSLLSPQTEASIQRALDELLAPAAARRRADLEKGLISLVQRMVGRRVRVKFEEGERLESEASRPTQGYPEGYPLRAPHGLYLPAQRLIKLALGYRNLIGTAFHEAWHDLEMHLLTPGELSLLIRETERLRAILISHFGVPKKIAAQFAGYEVRAYAFQAWANARVGGGPPIHTGVRALFERIARLLRQIRNLLRGYGFQTTESMFERAFEGGYATRPDRGVSQEKIDALASGLDPKAEPTDDYALRLAWTRVENREQELADIRRTVAAIQERGNRGQNVQPPFGAQLESTTPSVGGKSNLAQKGESTVSAESKKEVVAAYNEAIPSIKDQYDKWAGKNRSYETITAKEAGEIYGERADWPAELRELIDKHGKAIEIIESQNSDPQWHAPGDAPTREQFMRQSVEEEGGLLPAADFDDIMQGLETRTDGAEIAASNAFKVLARSLGWEPVGNGARYFTVRRGKGDAEEYISVRISDHGNLTRNPNAPGSVPTINLAPRVHDFNDAIEILSRPPETASGADTSTGGPGKTGASAVSDGAITKQETMGRLPPGTQAALARAEEAYAAVRKQAEAIGPQPPKRDMADRIGREIDADSARVEQDIGALQEHIDRDIAELNQRIDRDIERLSQLLPERALRQDIDPKAEPGADGKPQLIIPGAEKITDKERAEREARKAKRGSKPQKGTDGLPLFGEGEPTLFSSLDPVTPNITALQRINLPAELIADHLENKNLPKLASISRTLKLGTANTTEARVLLQDKFLRWKRIQEEVEKATGQRIPEEFNVYQAESLYYGRTGQRLEELDQMFIDPIIKEIGRQNLTAQEVDRYLMARHAPERNAQMRKLYDASQADMLEERPQNIDALSGMSNEEAATVIAEIEKDGKLPAYQAVERRVRKLIDETRVALLSGGLIDKATFDQWLATYKYYVPLRGFAEDAEVEGSRGGYGRGFDVRGPESKRALGRRSLADGPLAYAFLQAQQAIVRAEKAKVGRAAFRVVNANAMPELWEIKKVGSVRSIDKATGLVVSRPNPFWKEKDNVFAMKIDGETYFIEFKGEHGANLARALKNIGTGNMHVVMRMIASFTRLQARLATSWNPDFMIPNFVRDLGEAFINMQEQQQKAFVRRFARHLFPALAGSFQALIGKNGGKYAQAFREFDAAGGRIRFFGLENTDDIKANVARRLRQLEGGAINNIREAGEKAMNAIEIANGSIENATRLAVFMAAKDVGLSSAKAASIASELTVNFNRKGEWGSALTGLYMFANASIQGTARMITAMRNSKNVRRGAYALAAAAAAITAYNLAAGGDDDDEVPYYTKIPHWVRDVNLIIMWPKGLGRDGQYIKIPLPYGYSVFYVIGARLTTLSFGKEKPGKVAAAIGKSVLDAFDPLGKDENMLAQFSPTIVRPAVHLATNQNWTGRPINPESMPWNRNDPNSSRSFRSASEFAVGAAKKINELTGGSKREPGLIDLSPGSVDYMIGFLTGGTGRFAKNLSDTITRGYQGQEWQVDKTPIVRRFVGANDTAGSRALYFEDREKVKAVFDRATGYAKDNNRAAEARLKAENSAEYNSHSDFTSADKQRRGVLKAIDEIKAKPGLSAVEREKQIKAKEAEELALMLRARRALRDRREGRVPAGP